MLDQYITDFLEAMQHWHESQTALATDESLHSMVKIMRMVLFEKNTFRMALSTQENAALYLDFLNPACRPRAGVHGDAPHGGRDEVYGEQSDHLVMRRSTCHRGPGRLSVASHPDGRTRCSSTSSPA